MRGIWHLPLIFETTFGALVVLAVVVGVIVLVVAMVVVEVIVLVVAMVVVVIVVVVRIRVVVVVVVVRRRQPVLVGIARLVQSLHWGECILFSNETAKM